MPPRTHLFRTAKEIFKLSFKDWLVYNAVIWFARITGLWRYPIQCNGDVEFMKKKDFIYWIYKSAYPIRRATRGSGLEAFFGGQDGFRWKTPEGFKAASEISLSAVGDLMEHPFLANSEGSLYSEVSQVLFGADISTANLECVIYPKAQAAFEISTKSPPPLYYKIESFNAVKGHGEDRYSFLSTACNHSLDCGEEGVLSTIEVLKENRIAFNGVNETEADSKKATLLERKGIKVAFFSHTFGLNAKKPPKEKPWIVNRTPLNGKLSEIDFSQIKSQIQFCKESGADLIAAQLHWGLEHEFYPRPDQLDLAHHLAEMGVDLLIGHHPHVVQPLEFYRTQRDPERVVPIYYSLGNLVNPFSHPDFCRGYLAQVRITKGQTRDGKVATYVTHAGRSEIFQTVDESQRKIRLVLKRNMDREVSRHG